MTLGCMDDWIMRDDTNVKMLLLMPATVQLKHAMRGGGGRGEAPGKWLEERMKKEHRLR